MKKQLRMVCSLALLIVMGLGVVTECVAAVRCDNNLGVQAGSRIGRL